MTKEQRKELRHAMNYIDWGLESVKANVSHTQWNSLIDYYAANGKEVVFGNNERGKKTKRAFWFPGSWHIQDRDADGKPKNVISLYCLSTNYKYYIYNTFIDLSKNDANRMSGAQCYREFNKYFDLINDCDLVEAFGKMDKDKCDLYANCASAINVWWINKSFNNRLLHHVSKADYKSCFAYCALGVMPDAHTAVHYDTVVEPTADYPFAFYDNGDTVIYNEVDTRLLHNHEVLREPNSDGEYRWTAEPKSTILMAPSKYTLDDVINHFYQLKEKAAKGSAERDRNKAILVQFFGYIYSIKKEVSNTNKYLPHITAICHARYIKMICDLFDDIVAKGGKPIQILTDSIIYKDIIYDGAVSTNNLGDFKIENTDCDCYSYANGQYVLENKKDGQFIWKHQSIKINDESKYPNLRAVNEFMISDKPKRQMGYNKNTHRFEETNGGY